MRRYYTIFAAVVLCVCLSACTDRPLEMQGQAAAGPTVQTTEAVANLEEAIMADMTDESFPISGSMEGLPLGDHVLTPGEMPEKPEADYTLPPQEPGQTGSC